MMSGINGPYLCKLPRGRQPLAFAQRTEQLRARNTQTGSALSASALRGLRCVSCGSEWLVRETDLEEQRVCPFCGRTLRERERVAQYDSLGTALYGALAERGTDVLRQPKLLTEQMLALAPGLKKEIRIFTRVLAEEYARMIQAVLDGDETPLAQLRAAFIQEEGLSAEWADMICDGVRTASEIKQSAGKLLLKNADILPERYSAFETDLSGGAQLLLRAYNDSMQGTRQAREDIRASARPEPDDEEAALQGASAVQADAVPPGMQLEADTLVRYSGTDAVVRIPEGVRKIGVRAFAECDSVRRIELPSTAELIGSKAFYSCGALEQISLPEGLLSIGTSAFFNCFSLRSITVPSTVLELGSAAFVNCAALETIALPPGLIELREMTFAGCKRLRSVTLPEGLAAVGSAAFSGCVSLTELAFPRSTKRIAAGVFEHCVNLREITVSPTAEMDPNVFADAAPKVNFYPTIRRSRRDAPSELPEKELSYSACRSEYRAYSSHTETMDVPAGYTHITRRGMEPHAHEMRRLMLPGTVSRIDPDAFVDCKYLLRIHVSSDNGFYRSENGGRRLVEIRTGKLVWGR